MTDTNIDSFNLLDLTTQIVTAYVGKHHTAPEELPALVRTVHDALAKLGQPEPETVAVPQPAVPINKSVTDDYIICLEDGRKLKSLRRHLGYLGMTPDQYRSKYGLAKDYPMVAPAYAAKRSELAKALGLGRKRVDEFREAAE